MNLDEAIRNRLNEYLKERNISLTNLCLNSNLTSSTVFDFMYGKSKSPKIVTLKKLCCGLGITLSEFFDNEYFNNSDDIY